MSDSGGSPGPTSGFFQTFGDTDISEKQATGCITGVYVLFSAPIGLSFGAGLADALHLPTVGAVAVIAAVALAFGCGVGRITWRIARRRTEDKRLARLRAKYDADEQDEREQDAGDSRGGQDAR